MTALGTTVVDTGRGDRGLYLYNQAGDRLHPRTSGVCDCSSWTADVLERLGIVVKLSDRWTGNESAGMFSLGTLITTNAAEIRSGNGLQDGDLVFFRWSGIGLASRYHMWHHMGIVDAGRVQVIDQYGDLLPRQTGPDGRVHGHGPNYRALSDWVDRSDRVAVRRLLPTVSGPVPILPPPRPAATRHPRQFSIRDAAFIKVTQRALGVTVDGIWGPQTAGATRKMQQRLSVGADGEWGRKTTVAYLNSRGPFGIGTKDPCVGFVQYSAGDDTPDNNYGPITEGWMDEIRSTAGLGDGDGVDPALVGVMFG